MHAICSTVQSQLNGIINDKYCFIIKRQLAKALSPEDGFAKKPAPDMLYECCRVMGVKASETVMVGDTRFDVEAGFNAGCLAVAFAEHGYQDVPEEYASRVVSLPVFTDLLKLLHD